MIDVVVYGRQLVSHLQLFIEGLKRHGISAEYRPLALYRPSDLAVFWSHKKHEIIAGQRERGLDYLVMERGYFGDRFAMTSLGFNGLNGHAQFHNAHSPGDRWARHGVEVRSWKHDGECVVIMGQVPTDASLANCPSYARWMNESARKAREFYGLKVYFRPHPHPSAPKVRSDLPIIGGDLASCLRRAALAIVWNSNSGVDAVLAGVPLIATDRGTMAWPMAAHVVGAPIVRPERTQWLHDIAYAQWSELEISNGDAWEHLRQRYATKTAAA